MKAIPKTLFIINLVLIAVDSPFSNFFFSHLGFLSLMRGGHFLAILEDVIYMLLTFYS